MTKCPSTTATCPLQWHQTLSGASHGHAGQEHTPMEHEIMGVGMYGKKIDECDIFYISYLTP